MWARSDFVDGLITLPDSLTVPPLAGALVGLIRLQHGVEAHKIT
jgi:hypothetical protein